MIGVCWINSIVGENQLKRATIDYKIVSTECAYVSCALMSQLSLTSILKNTTS